MNQRSTMAGPDFIIIGAMKSATSSLQEQLSNMPGVFMTTPKEPNFFSNDEIFSKGIEWYSSLFDHSEKSDLRGEASTHYAKLPKYPQTISRLKSSFPNVKLIYIMRHPIDRLVSHFAHNWSMGFFPRNDSINAVVDRYEPLTSYSLYNMQLTPWLAEFGREAILPLFFDSLKQEPQRELERICSFVGYRGTPKWDLELQASNVSSSRIRKFPFYSILVESQFSTRIRRNLVPKSLREAVKRQSRLKSSPQLSEENIQRLQAIFDKDLSELGKLFDIKLNCENFKEVTATQSLDWLDR